MQLLQQRLESSRCCSS